MDDVIVVDDDGHHEVSTGLEPICAASGPSDVWELPGESVTTGFELGCQPLQTMSDFDFSHPFPSEHSGDFENNEPASLCPSPSTPRQLFEPVNVSDANLPQSAVSDAQWRLGVVANHSQFAQQPTALLLPWETGIYAEIFGTGSVLQLPASHLPEPDSELMDKVITASEALADEPVLPTDACFHKAVRNIQDLDYFASKNRQLELACGQWLELLSCCWYASGVGEMLAGDMQKDSSGKLASETLQASFGTKSPQTLLKRAASLRRYFKWHACERSDASEIHVSPLPLSEPDVWEFFNWLKACRLHTGRGYTNQAAFLETARFAKFCLDL